MTISFLGCFSLFLNVWWQEHRVATKFDYDFFWFSRFFRQTNRNISRFFLQLKAMFKNQIWVSQNILNAYVYSKYFFNIFVCPDRFWKVASTSWNKAVFNRFSIHKAWKFFIFMPFDFFKRKISKTYWNAVNTYQLNFSKLKFEARIFTNNNK